MAKETISSDLITVTTDDNGNTVIQIETAKKNSIRIDDALESITIQDRNKNLIVMNKQGIQIKSLKNIVIDASDKLILKGRKGIIVETSNGDIDISAKNIALKASKTVSVKSNAVNRIWGKKTKEN